MKQILLTLALMVCTVAQADIVSPNPIGLITGTSFLFPMPALKYRCAGDPEAAELRLKYGSRLQAADVISPDKAISKGHDTVVSLDAAINSAQVKRVLGVQCFTGHEGSNPINWVLFKGTAHEVNFINVFFDQQPVDFPTFKTAGTLQAAVPPGSFFVHMINNGDTDTYERAVWYFIMVDNPLYPN